MNLEESLAPPGEVVPPLPWALRLDERGCLPGDPWPPDPTVPPTRRTFAYTCSPCAPPGEVFLVEFRAGQWEANHGRSARLRLLCCQVPPGRWSLIELGADVERHPDECLALWWAVYSAIASNEGNPPLWALT